MASIKLVSFEEELKKNPKLKESDIQILREWCKKQPHLPKITDSEFALFLHSNYYQLEPTKSTIDNFFTVRTHVPEFFYNRDLNNNKELKQAIEVITIQSLERNTREGYKIIYGRLLDNEPSKYVFNDAIKLLFMVMDLCLYTENICDGYVFVCDMKDFSLGHINRLNLIFLKKFFYYLQEGLPIRLKSSHLINISPIIDMLLNMVKPLMKKQLMDTIYTHTTNDTLEKFVPLDILPNEAGGQGSSVQELHNKQIQKLVDHFAWFREEEANHRVNESLRPGKAKTVMDLFGVEGTFKKLEID
ncbi:PREDICTED: alpha-tocopherol transfer protein-like [Cyphomyrmex costatus]|uniref:Alpha-tocopherol transfer protein-like protein n=1 Tax=Cyphomyrmex costatus TaxID=456900 RepID=A0A195CB81_9HYME|nr:PREDICTED: alpha-tocopherol transfer protein-like [Cyphomyrmex costatus]KYM98124.1 Alpha-tocopherol transfer protein-like protein [Cyphomyrmex costatus]